MRQDLDRLMQERGLQAFIVPPSEVYSPAAYYLAGGILCHPWIIKVQGREPLLLANHMEVEEAQKSGYEVINYDALRQHEIIRDHGEYSPKGQALWWARFFDLFQIKGRVSFYGTVEAQTMLRWQKIISTELAAQVELVHDTPPDILSLAAETKDAAEIALMRSVGERASAVMRATRHWLSQQRVGADEGLLDERGQALTIGAVKRYVRGLLMEQALEDVGGAMIFAQGRDAGIPHNRGQEDMPLRLGQAIIFDLFPRSMGGGYFHDMTRTWCLGYAPPQVQQDFEAVLGVYYKSLEGVTLGRPVRESATEVCQWFEAAGHPTRLNQPETTEGYVHSLGHGLGLMVHESPGIRHLSPPESVFKAGHVVTIEPGLYYPERGYGIRIEDTVYLDDKGNLQNLTDCPYELVIPMVAQ
jgi:Xaa-Pro aminopeptidase